MPTEVKKTVRELLNRLPEDCTIDDVLYHLYVIQSVERGRAEAASGQLISHEDVARELRRRWQTDRSA